MLALVDIMTHVEDSHEVRMDASLLFISSRSNAASIGFITSHLNLLWRSSFALYLRARRCAKPLSLLLLLPR